MGFVSLRGAWRFGRRGGGGRKGGSKTRETQLRWALESIGAALLLVFPLMAPCLASSHLFLYHHRLPIGPLVNGLMLDALGIAVAGYLLLAASSAVEGGLRRILGGLLAGAIVWGIMRCSITLLAAWQATDPLENKPPGIVGALGRMWFHGSVPMLVCLASGLAALSLAAPSMAGRIVRVTRLALAAMAFCCLWILPNLLVTEVRAHAARAVMGVEGSGGRHQGRQGRIVWILLDELSYKLVLDEPAEGQSFPNIEKLSAESLSLANVQPVANYTDLVVPSLLARRSMVAIRGTSAGWLQYREKGEAGWTDFEAAGTLFATARAEGWNPGVVGWHIPYCRLFGDTLARCFWQSAFIDRLSFESRAEENSALVYSLEWPERLGARLMMRKEDGANQLQPVVNEYRTLMEQNEALLRDERIHFAFLHMPVPHPPGIYDRKTHRLCGCGNYLDNLALADESLGVLLRWVDETSAGNPTTVIVSSDHSWRVPLWKASPWWSEEEERVSGGQFDSRPVFLVHFAGQTAGSEIRRPVPELVEHDVVEGMLEGKIRGPQDVEALVRAETEQ
jgi:hypothetical protein